MMTAWFRAGASLFALLIVDTCCLPVKQGPKSSASQNYNDAAPFAGSSQIGVQREAAASFSSSSSSGPALSGYRGDSVRLNPASSAHSGAAFQPASGDMNWAVAPLSGVSAGMERSAGNHGIGSSGPANVSPPIYPPPPPAYQAGELSHLEEAFEHGDYEMETEDQGFYPPPLPIQASAGQAFTSQPLPGPGMGRYWGGGYRARGNYPYYDYMFLTGQYPPGTYTHLTFNQEQGMDNWEDAHYKRYYPAQQTETVAVPQRSKDPRPAVKAHYG